MTLSRELLDKVNEEVLSPSPPWLTIDAFDGKLGPGGGLCRYDLRTALLRTSKTIHEEATQVLYEKHGVIISEMEPHVHREVRELISGKGRGGTFFGDYFNARMLKQSQTGGNAVMKLSLTTCLSVREIAKRNERLKSEHDSRNRWSYRKDEHIEDQACVAVAFYTIMPDVCRFLTMSLKKVNMRVKIVVSAATLDSLRGFILACLKEARGFDEAALTVSGSLSSHEDLTKLMKTKYDKVKELLDRASWYQSRVREQTSAGDLNAAEYTLYNVQGFLKWST